MTTANADVRQHILDVAKPLMLAKGFTAVGLTELLATAGIPKGSFYHYFGSKEAFGEALLDAYFCDYLLRLDALLAQPGTAAQRLMQYWSHWQAAQLDSPAAQGQCLVVKLGAEVCDLSESMRVALERGTCGIIERLTRCIEAGEEDGSLSVALGAETVAVMLYQMWLGASLLAKFSRDCRPLDTAMMTTRQLLNLDSRS